MEIILKRIAKRKTYTIGRMYVVPNGVVKREILPGKHLDDKRIIRYEVDESQLTQEHYFCDTLEPTWRNLLGIDLKPEEVDARYSRQSGKKARKVPGKTAIPEGSYPVVVTKSPPLQDVASPAARRARFRGHPHPRRQLSRRYAGLHPRGREQAGGHGGELPRMASQAHRTHHRGEGEGRGGMDYHRLRKHSRNHVLESSEEIISKTRHTKN